MKDQSKTKQAKLKSKRRKVEQALKERAWTILENIQEGYYEVDLAGNYTFFNPSMSKILGYTEEEMMGMNYRLYMDKESAKKIFRDFNEVYRTGISSKVDYEQIKKDGSKMYVETSVALMRDSSGQPTGFRGIVRDITERRQAEEALRESEKRYREFSDFLPISIFEIDASGSIVSLNQNALEVFRYNQGNHIEGMNALQFFPREEWQRVRENMGRVIQGTSIPGHEYTFFRKDGSTFIGLAYSSRSIRQDKTVGIRGAIIDITQRRRAEEALRESEEKYRSIVENAQEGIYRTTPEGRFITVNRAMADMLGYDSPEELIASFTDIAHQLYVNPEDRTKLRRMVGEHGSVKGFETQFYRKDGNWIWVSINIRAVHDTSGRILYYEGINEDITIRKQAEDERKQSFERLRRALRATIEAVAMTVEMRDPYTAGHQRRVSDLARAIATEMGLSGERIDGIRTAGTIHDIGKLCIPSEILSNPTKLTNIEFSLIKEHSRKGYEILKNVESPWPLAEIIYQHHERMDGSGYPRNLKGDDILMEARILAVADVVEAMGSHRPYRPSLGIDAALEEIENKRGTHYDTSVVDACLRIFRENGYQLKQT